MKADPSPPSMLDCQHASAASLLTLPPPRLGTPQEWACYTAIMERGTGTSPT